MNSATTVVPQTGPYAQFPPDYLAKLRSEVRQYRQQGYKMSEVDKALKSQLGVSVAQVMEPNPDDFKREIMQGLTLGHADEAAGLLAKLKGGDYTQARDQYRAQDQAFAQNNPLLAMGTQAAAGAIPGMLTAPLAVIQKGATLANVLRGAGVAAGVGAIAGEGNSNATSIGGVAKDAAVSAALSAPLGAAGSFFISKVASAGNPLNSAGPVAREASSQLPSDPSAMQAMLQRQEQLAPGTVVMADLSPGMQKFVRAVGADRNTAMAVRDAADARIQALATARKGIGRAYDDLNGLTVPADDQITAILNDAGRRDLINNAGEVDLGDLHEVRSAMLRAGRQLMRSPDPGMKANQLLNGAGQITDWMTTQFPRLPQIDADYAFLTDRLKAAKATQKVIANSSSAYAANRAAGVESGSLGATIPNKSTVGATILQMVKPDRAARAREIANLLLTPQRDATGLGKLVMVHNALTASQLAPGATAANAALSGGAIPGLIGSLP